MWHDAACLRNRSSQQSILSFRQSLQTLPSQLNGIAEDANGSTASVEGNEVEAVPGAVAERHLKARGQRSPHLVRPACKHVANIQDITRSHTTAPDSMKRVKGAFIAFNGLTS
jgi:hypothetical protein